MQANRTRKRIIAAMLVSTTAAAGAARAQDAETIYAQGQQAGLTALQSSASVVQLGAPDISATGANNVMEAIQRLVPSANIPLGAANTYSSVRAARSISLHGLGTDETLILIDGQRQHHAALVNTYLVYGRGTQSVDLDTIALSAIDHIEILQGGAAAQYGSDAIGGVVNIVLKKASEGGSATATVGVFPARDKPQGVPTPSTLYQGTFATGWAGNGYADLSFDVENLYHPREGYPDTRQQYFPGDPREATVDRTHWCTCSFPGPNIDFKVNGTAGKPITNDLEAYGFVNYGHTFKKALGFTTVPSSDSNVRAITPDGYQAQANSLVNDYTGALGLRYDGGDAGNFDLSGNYGVYNQSLHQINSENAALGLATPRNFYLGSYINTEANVDLTWTKPVFLSQGLGTLDLSGGLSYRHENYQQLAGEYASYATGGRILDGPNAGNLAPSAGGTSPQDAVTLNRDVEGIWGNAEERFSGSLLAGVALRVENYSDFGVIHTEKGWVEYRPLPGWSLTADVSSGFRAPGLGQEGYSLTSYGAFNGVYLQTRSLPADSAIARELGGKPLDPENSVSYTLGAKWTPDETSVISLEGYSTQINNRITFTNTITGTLVTRILTAAGHPEIRGVTFFVNGLDTITHGADLTGRKTFSLGDYGTLDTSLGFSWTQTHVSHLNPNPPELAGSGLVLIDRRIEGLYTHATPDTKTILGAAWNQGGWTIGFTEKRYGNYKDFDPTTPANDETFPVQFISDLNIRYRFEDGISLAAGADNLFDSRPGIVKNKSLSVQGFGLNKYSDLAPEGMDGTYIHLSLGYTY